MKIRILFVWQSENGRGACFVLSKHCKRLLAISLSCRIGESFEQSPIWDLWVLLHAGMDIPHEQA
jgi:hypothetical protein